MITDEQICTCAVCREAFLISSNEEVAKVGGYVKGNSSQAFVCNACLSEFFYSCSCCGSYNLLVLEYRLPGEDRKVCRSCYTGIARKG